MNRQCKNCKKEIKGHPNKKFCSNKGINNCKDLYHNRINPRGYDNRDSYEDYLNGIHPFSCEGLGQWDD